MSFFLEDTKLQIYWEDVIKPYTPRSEIGLELWKMMKPYEKGQEGEWQKELEQIDILVKLFREDKDRMNDFEILFSNYSDVKSLFDKISYNDFKSIEPLFEGFHLKKFLWFSYSLSKKIINLVNLKKDLQFDSYVWFKLANNPWDEWLKFFNKGQDNRIFYQSFSLKDIDNEILIDLRSEKRKLVLNIKKAKDLIHQQIENKYQTTLNYEGNLLVFANDRNLLSLSKDDSLKLIKQSDEHLVFSIIPTVEEEKLTNRLYELEALIQSEEKSRITDVLEQIKDLFPLWNEASTEWGRFELLVKKAKMALNLNAVRPIMVKGKNNHLIIYKGNHPYLERLLNDRKRKMEPINIEIDHNVTVLYGANMGGKTIALKTIGLLQALAQYGFFVPAEKFEFSFVSHISIITGDYQNIEAGLSSFGAEIVRLKHDFSHKEALYLMDEIGKGTNPIEGEALAIAVLRYLKQQNSLTVLVSHFPKLIEEDGVGLYEAKEYKLIRITKGNMVYEAINQAEILGLPESIIDEAKKYLVSEDGGK